MVYTNVTDETIIIKRRFKTITFKPGESKFIATRKSENYKRPGLVRGKIVVADYNTNDVKEAVEAVIEEVAETIVEDIVVEEEVVTEEAEETTVEDTVVEEDVTKDAVEEDVITEEAPKKTRKSRKKKDVE